VGSGKWPRPTPTRCSDEHIGRTITFAALREQVHAYAHSFRSRGLEQGAVVAALLSNRIEFVVTYLACIESGLYFVPVNFHLTDSEVSYILDNAQAICCSRKPLRPTATVAAHATGLAAPHRLAVDDTPVPIDWSNSQRRNREHSSTTPSRRCHRVHVRHHRQTEGRVRELGRGDVLATLDLFASVVLGAIGATAACISSVLRSITEDRSSSRWSHCTAAIVWS